MLRTQHNMQFSRDNHQLIIELHWEVAPHLFASTVNGERLWQDLITLDLNGTPVKTFSPEDLLFSLCVHGSRHLWERLGWICDVAELITRRPLDWTALLKRAASADTERMFLLGVHLAERLLDAPLPAEVKQRCDSDQRLSSLADNDHRTPLQWTDARAGHVARDLQIQHRRPKDAQRTCSLSPLYVSPHGQRSGVSLTPGQPEFCVLPHATVSSVSYENLTDFFARVSFTRNGRRGQSPEQNRSTTQKKGYEKLETHRFLSLCDGHHFERSGLPRAVHDLTRPEACNGRSRR